jgi:hypothetical protein
MDWRASLPSGVWWELASARHSSIRCRHRCILLSTLSLISKLYTANLYDSFVRYRTQGKRLWGARDSGGLGRSASLAFWKSRQPALAAGAGHAAVPGGAVTDRQLRRPKKKAPAGVMGLGPRYWRDPHERGHHHLPIRERIPPPSAKVEREPK